MIQNNDLLKQWYRDSLEKLKTNLNIKNSMQVPKIKKIVINVGLKEAVTNSKIVSVALNTVTDIAGQKAVKTLSKKSIAGFKIREGMPIGVFVTLRGSLMYAFLNKLINLVFPKIRDFQGLPTKLDGRGNYNLGLKDIGVFPEAETAGVSDFSSGLNVTIVTSAENDKDAYALLEALGMPFYRKK